MKPLILGYLIVSLVVGGALYVLDRIAGKRDGLLAYVACGLAWPLIVGGLALEWWESRETHRPHT